MLSRLPFTLKQNINFRAGLDSLPAVQPASVMHELVRFQCRQYSLDERSYLIYNVFSIACRIYFLVYALYCYIDYDLCPGNDKFPGFLFIR